jgi:serine protein kinase
MSAEQIRPTEPAEDANKYSFFDDLEQYRDEQEDLRWHGSFEDYLAKVEADPSLAKTAHQLVYGAISRPGFFTSGRHALYGAEEASTRLVDTMRAGARGSESGRRIVLLLGPPGSGKSTMVNATKEGVEEYSRTDEGAVYGIEGCPMQEDPLHLIPKGMRADFKNRYGVKVEGGLCPKCRDGYDEASKDGSLREMPVERVLLSEEERVGVGSFKPSDPKSQDITELVGSVDFSKLGEYGSASDPNAYRFDVELNVANRGVMEFVELLKSDERFLYSLLDLTQDRVIKAPRFPNIYADEVILAHTYLAEYNKYMSDEKNEALRDRIVLIPVPYNLKISDERKIHEKLIQQDEKVQNSSVHISPSTLETAAMFAVLSRLGNSNKYSKLQKLKIYDGQEAGDLTQRDIRELKQEHEDEGMSGISPRYVIDSLSSALSKDDDKTCLTPRDAIRALEANLKYHPHTATMKPDEKKAIIDNLSTVAEEYDQFAKREVHSAFVYSYEEQAKSLCDNYLDNIDAYCNEKP